MSKFERKSESKPKQPIDIIEYIPVLIRVLKESQNPVLDQVEDLQKGLHDLPEDKLLRLKSTTLEDLGEQIGSDNIANLIISVNKLRSDIGKEDWGNWGKRIRDLKNKAKHRNLKLLTETRDQLHTFFQVNKDFVVQEYKDMINQSEGESKVTRNVTNHSFTAYLTSEVAPTKETFFEDLQAKLLLELSNKLIKSKTTKTDGIVLENAKQEIKTLKTIIKNIGTDIKKLTPILSIEPGVKRVRGPLGTHKNTKIIYRLQDTIDKISNDLL